MTTYSGDFMEEMEVYNACRWGRVRDFEKGMLFDYKYRFFKYKHRNLTPMMLACEYGQLELLEFLLARGDDANLRDNKGRSALSYALISDSPHAVAMVKLLFLQGRTFVDEGDVDGATPLMRAAGACRQHVELLPYLMDKGYRLDERDRFGKTPFLHACEHRSLAATRFCLAHGSRVDECSHGGRDALYWVGQVYRFPLHYPRKAYEDRDELLHELVRLGLDAVKIYRNGRSLLFDLCDSSHPYWPSIELLILAGADVLHRTPSGLTLLMALTRHRPFRMWECSDPYVLKRPTFFAPSDQLEVMQQLVARGVDAEAFDVFGRSALTHALREQIEPIYGQDYGYEPPLGACMKLLLELTCRLWQDRDAQGRSALDHATKLAEEEYYYKDTLTLLQQFNCLMESNPAYPDTLALFVAAGSDEDVNAALHVLKAAQHAGVDLATLRSLDGESLLMRAAAHAHSSTVLLEFLLAQSSDLEARDDLGRTAFLYACHAGCMIGARYLRRHGANVHAVDKQGEGAISYASRFYRKSSELECIPRFRHYDDLLICLLDWGLGAAAVESNLLALVCSSPCPYAPTVAALLKHGALAHEWATPYEHPLLNLLCSCPMEFLYGASLVLHHEEILRMLIAAGLDINATFKSDCCFSVGDEPVVDEHVVALALSHAPEHPFRRTPLALLDVLVEAGLDLNAFTGLDHNLVISAARELDSELVAYWMEKGVSFDCEEVRDEALCFYHSAHVSSQKLDDILNLLIDE